MRVAVISDLHGNLLALEAVLEDIERNRVDELVCLGDVAVGPQASETIARLREVGCPVITGNWDAWFVEGIPPIPGEIGRILVEQSAWWAEGLSPSEREYLRGLLPELELPLGDGTLLCVHGSPRSFLDFMHAGTPERELEAMLAGRRATVIAGGHTHVPMLRVFRGSLLVNPGSVGLPFESWPPPGPARVCPWAEYAVVDSVNGSLSIELRRAEYDLDELLELTLASGVPHARWWVDCWQTS